MALPALLLVLLMASGSWAQMSDADAAKKMEDEMVRNREYNCVASCFSLSGAGGKGSKAQPECVIDFRSISSDCDDLTKKLEIVQTETGRYFYGKEKKNWHEASRWCRQNGLQLAGLESLQEHNIVADKIPGATVNDNYWIAGCDHVTDNAWYWVETGEDFDYRNWDDKEPNDYTKKDILRCVMLKVNGVGANNIRWADDDCMTERKFVCEMPEICYKQYCNTS